MISGWGHRFRATLYLAFCNARYEWRLILCFVIALTAVEGPLLVLFGLKFGIVDGMTRGLTEDPRNRELIPVGSGHFDSQWFHEMGRRADIAFLSPRTRLIAGEMHLGVSGGTNASPIEMVPTGVGDPLLGDGVKAPEGYDEVALSAAAMRRIGAVLGDKLEGSISRIVGNNHEQAKVTLKVVSVLNESATAREIALVPLDLLLASEQYRDGFGNKALGWPGKEATLRQEIFASFRLYARTIWDVAKLRDHLAAQGIEIRSRSDDIALVESLDDHLSVIFKIVALLGICGFSASLGANIWLNVDMKRRDLSLIRILGAPTAGIVIFPMIHALLIGGLGLVLSIGVYQLAAMGLNTIFADIFRRGEICRLLPEHLVIASAFTVGIAALVSMLGGLRAAAIEPAKELRNV